MKGGSSSATVDKVIALALEQLDKPYVYATRGPASFDCAGLTLYCYQKVCCISLGRSAQSQGYNEKYPKIETISQLLPGDLVFFNTEPEDYDLTDHVGIYLGNGRFVHASSSGKKVMISSLSSGFYKKKLLLGPQADSLKRPTKSLSKLKCANELSSAHFVVCFFIFPSTCASASA